MPLPPVNLSWFADSLAEVVEEISDAWVAADRPGDEEDPTPALLSEALQQLTDVLRTVEWEAGDPQIADTGTTEGVDIGELGGYGQEMLTQLYQIAHELALPEVPEQLEQLALSLALWVSRQGGELRSIDLVVNGLARIANATTDTFELERLFHTFGEILEALLMTDPGHPPPESAQEPWRLLLLNRAIVATRAHLPRLMERAFHDIAERLPEVAPDFFNEGMEQIRVQGYPKPVSEVIERYHRLCTSSRRLH
ncbi:MAG TPA: hypothetical protein ENK50_07645 [Sedimenticola sp.]|nr:hypothetical protein [Sedimenticola sp.]